MRFRFDRFFKRMLRKVLAKVGRVQAEVEVAVDAQRIDILFFPEPRSRNPGVDLGLLGRIAESAAVVEAFHVPPTRDEIRSVIRKLLAWHHLQLLQGRRRPSRAGMAARQRGGSDVGPATTATDAQPAAPPPGPVMPTLWIVSSGRPEGAMDGFSFRPLDGWPRGVYVFPPVDIPVRLVVVQELPETRDTLTLRLMGRGATAARAALELGGLPHHSWEQRVLASLVVGLRKNVDAANRTGHLTEEEKEVLVTGEQMLVALEKKAWKQGRQEGRQEGLAEGQRRAAEVLAHMIERKIGRPLTDEHRTTVLQRLEALGPDRLGDVLLDLDAPTLAAWLANPEAR